jgi:hypothetical protein
MLDLLLYERSECSNLANYAIGDIFIIYSIGVLATSNQFNDNERRELYNDFYRRQQLELLA